MPKDIQNRDAKWQPQEYPKDLAKIKTIFDWNKYDNEFKTKWIDYIETEFDRRDNGFWFMNKKQKTYITGTHYMYLQ